MDYDVQEQVLDLYRNPLNKGLLKNATLQYKIDNPLCGDQVELTVKLDENDTVVAVGWEGNGCSISQIGASLLTNYIKNKSREELKKITSDEVIQMTGLNLNPTRLRCLLLAFTALQKIFL